MSRQIAQPSAHYELAPDEALALVIGAETRSVGVLPSYGVEIDVVGARGHFPNIIVQCEIRRQLLGWCILMFFPDQGLRPETVGKPRSAVLHYAGKGQRLFIRIACEPCEFDCDQNVLRRGK